MDKEITVFLFSFPSHLKKNIFFLGFSHDLQYLCTRKRKKIYHWY